MEITGPRWHLTLIKLLVTTSMVVLLNRSSDHLGATADTISLRPAGNGNNITSIGTGECLVDDDQYAEVELMMESETSRRLAPITFTGNTNNPGQPYTCGRPSPTCLGQSTGAPKGENCYYDNYNRACHKY